MFFRFSQNDTFSPMREIALLTAQTLFAYLITFFRLNFTSLFMKSSPSISPDALSYTLAMLLLRLWLGMRALLTGVEKFAGTQQSTVPVVVDGTANTYGLTESSAAKVYAISNYSGVPAELMDKFAAEPLIPSWSLSIYSAVLGPALILTGLFLLVGLFTRWTLFAMGLVYTSLSFGLILINQSGGVAWLAIHVLLVIVALVLSPYNRFTVLNKG
jgi:thiosulfate dehydrogenase [quinone] large subunit